MSKITKAEPVYDKRDYRSWKQVVHGVSSPHPALKRISLQEARDLGMNVGPELIIFPGVKTGSDGIR
jgi:hypothetical protein